MKTLLKTYFGYDRFRPSQEEVIRHVLKEKDTLVLMPTGGGKSLCYQLPALKFAGITLVISPLISLMKDQVDALKANGIAAEFLNSSLSHKEIAQVQNRLCEGAIKILYLAPERLAQESFQRFLLELKLSLIAVDEAHCISEWGHEFRPDYRNLNHLKEWFPQVPVIALTATATGKVQDDIVKQLSLERPRIFISSFDRENLRLVVLEKRRTFEKLLQLLEKYKNEPTIIYCFSRKETENLVESLRLEKIKALAYHAGLDKNTRRLNQELFTKDEVPVMAATIAFGMGIDKPDVRLIVHYTFPKTMEGYYQEVGRAGRDGLPSECVMFYSYGDKRKHEYFLNEMDNLKEQEKSRKKLNKVIEYCELTDCRRRFLLGYFGEKFPADNCGACDICLSPQTTFDATIIAQKVLSCVIRTGGRFGRNYIVDVLKGKNTQKIVNNRHHLLSVHNIVPDLSEDEIKHVIKLLLARGLLKMSDGEYPTISLAEQGANWLKQRDVLELPEMPKSSMDQQRKSAPEQINNYDTALFERLRSLRKQIADRQAVPPFVIFGDVSLREMAYYLPHDTDNFSRIKGVGSRKLADYGESFMAVIKDHIQQNRLTSIEVPRSSRKRDKKPKTVKSANPSYGITKDMIQKKTPISEIVKERGLTQSTIVNHLEKLLTGENDLDIAYLMPPEERREKMWAAFARCGIERLKPVYEALEGGYSYDEIRLGRLLYKLKCE